MLFPQPSLRGKKRSYLVYLKICNSIHEGKPKVSIDWYQPPTPKIKKNTHTHGFLLISSFIWHPSRCHWLWRPKFDKAFVARFSTNLRSGQMLKVKVLHFDASKNVTTRIQPSLCNEHELVSGLNPKKYVRFKSMMGVARWVDVCGVLFRDIINRMSKRDVNIYQPVSSVPTFRGFSI